MNFTRRLLLAVPFLLIACGGSTASTGQPGDPIDPAAAASASGSTTPRAPSTTNPASTIAFAPGTIVASRTPVHARCDEANPLFTDDDLFTLQPLQEDGASKVRSIAINFRRTVTTSGPLALVDGPGGPATFDGARQAHSPDQKTGVELVVFASPQQPGAAPASLSPLEQATVTMLQVPAKDGEPITARVELHLADGGVLDMTFSAPLVSYKGACATP